MLLAFRSISCEAEADPASASELTTTIDSATRRRKRPFLLRSAVTAIHRPAAQKLIPFGGVLGEVSWRRQTSRSARRRGVPRRVRARPGRRPRAASRGRSPPPGARPRSTAARAGRLRARLGGPGRRGRRRAPSPRGRRATALAGDLPRKPARAAPAGSRRPVQVVEVDGVPCDEREHRCRAVRLRLPQMRLEMLEDLAVGVHEPQQ